VLRPAGIAQRNQLTAPGVEADQRMLREVDREQAIAAIFSAAAIL
jgi:hypothetical protein